MSVINLPIDEIATDTPVFDDVAGSVTAAPEGAVLAFTPGDPSVASLTVSSDGKSAVITPITLGSYTYSVSATRADGSALTGYSQEIAIVAGQAVSIVPGLVVTPKA